MISYEKTENLIKLIRASRSLYYTAITPENWGILLTSVSQLLLPKDRRNSFCQSSLYNAAHDFRLELLSPVQKMDLAIITIYAISFIDQSEHLTNSILKVALNLSLGKIELIAGEIHAIQDAFNSKKSRQKLFVENAELSTEMLTISSLNQVIDGVGLWEFLLKEHRIIHYSNIIEQNTYLDFKNNIPKIFSNSIKSTPTDIEDPKENIAKYIVA